MVILRHHIILFFYLVSLSSEISCSETPQSQTSVWSRLTRGAWNFLEKLIPDDDSETTEVLISRQTPPPAPRSSSPNQDNTGDTPSEVSQRKSVSEFNAGRLAGSEGLTPAERDALLATAVAQQQEHSRRLSGSPRGTSPKAPRTPTPFPQSTNATAHLAAALPQTEPKSDSNSDTSETSSNFSSHSTNTTKSTKDGCEWPDPEK